MEGSLPMVPFDRPFDEMAGADEDVPAFDWPVAAGTSASAACPSGSAGAFAILPQAAIATRHDARILWVNAAGDGLLRRSDALAVVDGRLRCRRPTETLALRRRIAAASGSGRRRPGALSVEAEGPRRLAILVKPVAISCRANGADAPLELPAALLICGGAHANARIPGKVLSALYGLTLAEGRVAAAIVSGQTLQDYAAEWRVSPRTARWQLSRVLEKTGARRQTDLVRLILTGPAGTCLSEIAE